MKTILAELGFYGLLIYLIITTVVFGILFIVSYPFIKIHKIVS